MPTLCRLSATAYSVYPRLLSTSANLFPYPKTTSSKQSLSFRLSAQNKSMILLPLLRATCPAHLITLFTIVVIFIVNRYDVPNNRSKFQTQRRCQPLAPNIQVGGPASVSCPPQFFWVYSQLCYICAGNHLPRPPENAPGRGDNLGFTSTQTSPTISLQIHKQVFFPVPHSSWYMLWEIGCHRNLLDRIGGEECYVTASSLVGTIVRARCTLTWFIQRAGPRSL